MRCSRGCNGSSTDWRAAEVSEGTGQHCDDATLALVAVGQAAPSAVFERHSHTCPACSARRQSLTDVADLARDSLSERAYLQPPATVWRGIAAVAGDAGTAPDLVVELPSAGSAVDQTVDDGRRGPWPVIGAVAIAILLLLVVLGLLWW